MEVDDQFLADHVSGAKGGMELIDDPAVINQLIATVGTASKAPGGAASNTTVGAANLGIRSAFIGSIGQDELGTFYEQALARQQCGARLVPHAALPTAQVLSLVTPDAERTMRTYLGAAADLNPAAVSADDFAGARVVMLEGYTLFNHDLTRAIARATKAAGAKLALDFASFEVVQFNRDVLQEIVDDYADIAFVNEDEAKAWSGEDSIEASLSDLAARVDIAVVKVGKDGAWIKQGDAVTQVAAELVENVRDTTGAGDTWAAGFFSRLFANLPMDACGKLGAMAAAAVVQELGAAVPQEAWLKSARLTPLRERGFVIGLGLELKNSCVLCWWLRRTDVVVVSGLLG